MGEGANRAHSVKRTLWLIQYVLNHVLARQCDEMGLVGACNGDWVMEHLKELDINFLAKFCNIIHTFCTRVLLMYCVKSMYCIISCSLWASRMNFCLYLCHCQHILPLFAHDGCVRGACRILVNPTYGASQPLGGIPTNLYLSVCTVTVPSWRHGFLP